MLASCRNWGNEGGTIPVINYVFIQKVQERFEILEVPGLANIGDKTKTKNNRI